MKHFDVVVIGGGHAGCEAAHAAARFGAQVALVTLRMSDLGTMSCEENFLGKLDNFLCRELLSSNCDSFLLEFSRKLDVFLVDSITVEDFLEIVIGLLRHDAFLLGDILSASKFWSISVLSSELSVSSSFIIACGENCKFLVLMFKSCPISIS